MMSTDRDARGREDDFAVPMDRSVKAANGLAHFVAFLEEIGIPPPPEEGRFRRERRSIVPR